MLVSKILSWHYFVDASLCFRVAMVDGQGDLEDQLAEVKKKSAEIADRKEDLRIIEDLGAQMEEALILDNKCVIILDRTL